MERRRDPTLLWGLLLAFGAAVLRIRPLGAPDTWWHLNIGRVVLETGQRRFPDRMGIEVKEQFVAGEWGFDVLAWMLYGLGGPTALILFAAVATAGSCLLVWRLARDVAPTRPWTALAIAAAVVAATSWRFFPRPHILFLCFLPAAILLARRAARANTRPVRLRYLGGLLGLCGIWAQCHPSVIIAPAVVGLAGLPFAVGNLDPREGLRGLPRDLWIALAVLLIIPFTSPYGAGILDQVLGHSGTDSVAHIGEMQPLTWAEFWPPTSRSLLAVELLLVAGAVGLVRGGRIPLGPTGLAILGLMMTLNTHRFRAAWAILLVPLVADVVRPRREGAAWRALAVGAVLVSLGSVSAGWNLRNPSNLDLDWVPVALGDALDALDVQGDLFNDYDAGGYIGFRRFEQVRVFIDGRTPPYFTDDHFWAARKAQGDPALFGRLDAQHGFDAAIVERDAALCSALDGDARWAPAWFDNRRALFVRPGSTPTLEHLSPCATQSNVLACREAPDPAVFGAEMQRLFALSPTSPYLARLGFMLDLFCVQPDTADGTAWKGGFVLEPDDPELHWALGKAALGAGDPAGAVAFVADDSTTRSLRFLIETEAARGNAEGAREAAIRYLEAEGDATPADLLGLLAATCLETGDLRCAVHQGLRAALLGDARGKGVLSAVHQRGEVPFELRNLVGAALR